MKGPTNPQTLKRRKLVLTQGNVAASDAVLEVRVPAGGMVELDACVLLAGTFAAGRSHAVRTYNEGGEIVETHLANLSLTTGQRSHVSPALPTAAATADNTSRRGGAAWRVYGGDTLRVTGSSLAQNETLTVYLRWRESGTVTFASTTAGVSLASTEA